MTVMTSSEFEQWYANNAGVSVEELRAWGRVVVKCNCGEDGCEGWASLPRDVADFYIGTMGGGPSRYRYPAEGE